tara:strand:- start:394 stop:615 length:222 start_codon:yes stop_codon:yes gene_type:complete
MSWFFESDTAKEHKKKCKDPDNCDKCIWIDESHSAFTDFTEDIEISNEPVEAEPEMVWDKSIRRYTKGGKLCD